MTDADLEQLLAIVDPARNITTEWTFDTVKDWFHAFSGGQKQRGEESEQSPSYDSVLYSIS